MEFAFVLDKMENWKVVNASDKYLGKMSGQCFFGNKHYRNLPTHFAKMLVRRVDHFPIFHFAEDKGQFSRYFPKINRINKIYILKLQLY